MMCRDARRAMLSADRTELRAEGAGDLADHLRECVPCRALATRLDAETNLLAGMVTARDKTALRMAPAAHHRISRRYRRAWLVLVPLAAAAAVVVLLRREPPPELAAAPRAFEDRGVATAVAVDIQHGQTATVIRTRDPKVTIVWLTPGGSE